MNEQHPGAELGDVVLFLDSFADARLGDGGHARPGRARDRRARRRCTCARRDQVGLLSFGGSVNWLEPAMGTSQLYRIVEALLDTEVVLSLRVAGPARDSGARAAAAGARRSR